MSTMNPPGIEDIKSMVVARAANDAEFRASLVANPRAAVESWSGAALPPQVTIQVIEEAPDTYVVVLPHTAAVGAEGELTDDDLEAVAGGSKASATSTFKAIGSAMLLGPLLPIAVAASGVNTISGGKASDDWGKATFTDTSKKACN